MAERWRRLMIRFFGALMIVPITGAIGAFSAPSSALRESTMPEPPPRQPMIPQQPVQPAIQALSGSPPGEWSDIPLPPTPPVHPITVPAAVTHPEPPTLQPPQPQPRGEIEFSESPERNWKMDRDLN